MSTPFADSDLYRAVPSDPCGTGVLVLAGSSGRVDRARADLLARNGALAMSIRWFGGVGQRPVPHEVPLETFFAALDLLGRECDRSALLGTSFGAEAVLLAAAHDDRADRVDRVDAVVALAPTSVVWPGYADGWSSHWTLGGRPVPYVPFDAGWSPSSEPPAYRELYERSLAADDAVTAAAAIPVERIDGDVVLVAGGDDEVWPSTDFAGRIAQRRSDHGLPTRVITHPDAGHRVVLPGEPAPTGGVDMARGGTPDADAALGRKAWPHVVAALGLHT